MPLNKEILDKINHIETNNPIAQTKINAIRDVINIINDDSLVISSDAINKLEQLIDNVAAKNINNMDNQSVLFEINDWDQNAALKMPYVAELFARKDCVSVKLTHPDNPDLQMEALVEINRGVPSIHLWSDPCSDSDLHIFRGESGWHITPDSNDELESCDDESLNYGAKNSLLLKVERITTDEEQGLSI